MDKTKALYAAFDESTGVAMVEAIEPEAELFALAKQVDLAEKAFHGALGRRNKAHIAYLREARRSKLPRQLRQSLWNYSTQRSDGWPAFASRR
jgi:hypothetical protein